jgi:8-oxo-dGTP pyrophosphatase MutT (NUDIX family)
MKLRDFITGNKKKESAAVIFTDGEKFLATISSINRRIGLPKGLKDKGESDKQAAVREFYEETGHQISQANLKKLGKFTYSKEKDIIVFLYKVDSLPPLKSFKCLSYFDPSLHYKGINKSTSVPEIESYRYISIDNYRILRKNYHKMLKRVINKI